MNNESCGYKEPPALLPVSQLLHPTTLHQGPSGCLELSLPGSVTVPWCPGAGTPPQPVPQGGDLSTNARSLDESNLSFP